MRILLLVLSLVALYGGGIATVVSFVAFVLGLLNVITGVSFLWPLGFLAITIVGFISTVGSMLSLR